MMFLRRGKSSRESAVNEAQDGELVQGARSGDKRAFVEIVARYQGMVCGVALGILGDFSASEDAAQEAFLTAWRKIDDLRDPNCLRGWLAQIARNAALGHLRRKRGEEGLEEVERLVDEGAGPDEAAATEEECALVREALEQLPEKYRMPLVLFYREGESVREVAATLQISEDAVKQRLSRAREMLRERMSGVIEEVLKRGPGPVFTMTIAAAIGALAAPAVVAGSVFAGAAAGTAAAGAGGTSGTSFLVTMSTTKAIVATTAVIAVVCIPVGYQLGSAHEQARPQSADAVEPLPGAADAPAARMESGLFAEWRALHEKYGTNSQAMPVLHKAIGELRDESRKKAFHAALAAEWALVDPAGGFAFLKDGGQKRLLFEHWLKLDPDGAVDGLLKSENWEDLGRQVITEIARKAPGRLAEIASKLPKPRQAFWDTPVREAFAVAASTQGIEWAEELAEKVTGPSRTEAFAGVAQTWAKSDIDGTITWARALPGEVDRDEIIRAALIGRAKTDPIAALERLELVPPGGSSGYFASTTAGRVLGEAAKVDFEGTVTWLANNDQRLSREDLVGLARSVTERLNADATGFLARHAMDGSIEALVPAIQSALMNQAAGQSEVVWDWLKWQEESPGIESLKSSLLQSTAYHDPELAVEMAKDLPQTEEGQKQARRIMQGLLDGGRRLHRFEELYQEVPERLKGVLLEEAFGSLGGGVPNPEVWAERVKLLPREAQSQAAGYVALSWARSRPEEAWNWATGLGHSEARNAAISQVAHTWAGNDMTAAAEWIRGLPGGVNRDIAAASFVEATAVKDPFAGWEWAMSISDRAQAQRAAFHTVQLMATRDPVTARKWMESGPFDENVRARLAALIDNMKAGGNHAR